MAILCHSLSDDVYYKTYYSWLVEYEMIDQMYF